MREPQWRRRSGCMLAGSAQALMASPPMPPWLVAARLVLRGTTPAMEAMVGTAVMETEAMETAVTVAADTAAGMVVVTAAVAISDNLHACSAFTHIGGDRV